LRDDERSAAHVEQAAIEAPILVREDPQARDLAGKALGLRVVARDAEQDAETGSDLADDLAADAHPGG